MYVSYQHSHDQAYFDAFSALYSSSYGISGNSVRRDASSSCTIVLCGLETRWRTSVDREISATLDEEQGLIGVKLPNLRIGPDEGNRLQDNIESGYAVWVTWGQLCGGSNSLASSIEEAIARPKDLIRNGRPLRLRNGAV